MGEQSTKNKEWITWDGMPKKKIPRAKKCYKTCLEPKIATKKFLDPKIRAKKFLKLLIPGAKNFSKKNFRSRKFQQKNS